MPGRFRLVTDENIPGPLIDALKRGGWGRRAHHLDSVNPRPDEIAVLIKARLRGAGSP